MIGSIYLNLLPDFFNGIDHKRTFPLSKNPGVKAGALYFFF
jgi:hypothetical protein